MTRFGWPLLGLGALAALATAGQPWWRVESSAGGASLTGNLVSGGLASALPAVALVGLVLGWTLRRRGRRVLAGALALVGLGALWLGAAHPRPADGVLTDELRKVSLADDWTAAATAWPWAYAAASALVVIGAALALAHAGRERARARRFEPTAPPPVDGEGSTEPGATAVEPGEADLDQWRALDAGVDPTVSAPISSSPPAREE